MTKHADPLSRLPELPLEAFELSAKLDYSKDAPVITNRFKAITVKRKPVPTPHVVSRASHELSWFWAWLTYPHVVCTPMPEPEVMARVRMEPSKGLPPQHAGDLAAIAEQRLFFKLSRFHGGDLPWPWVCEVRYGPWFGHISYVQSCYDGVPDQWALTSSVLDMQIQWEGGPGDMPSLPNLTVWWDPNRPEDRKRDCCPGHYMCHGNCIPDRIKCPGLIPA